MDERSWRRLLDKIAENNVVPVLGAQLYVGPDGVSLQAKVAERLFAAAGVPAPPGPLPRFRELNEAVSHLKEKVRLQDLYDYVHDAIRETIACADFVMPEAIQQIAEIADFRLLVALTPDGLLATALRRRCAVNEIVHSPSLPTSEGRDIPADWSERPGEVQLLYLFGKARSAPMFAIHDEDVLEYAHNMMTRGSQVPALFLGELRQRNLLLLGCNFPDWLSRFFLRATNTKRLSENGKRSWLIEPLKAEESLTCFLGTYSQETEVLADMPPTVFFAELHRRWMLAHGTKATEAPRAEGPGRAMFFISYSRSTDRANADRLLEALNQQGVSSSEIWFDHNSIEPGQAFRDRILDGISHCRYFLPLLSRASNERSEAFVFREWRAANERTKDLNVDTFVLPVVVDQEFDPSRYTADPVRAWRDIDFGHAPGGVPDERLATRFKSLVRAARQS